MSTALVDARTVAAQPTAVRRAVLRPGDVDEWLSETLGEIAESLRLRRIVPNGFPFSRRHPAPDGRVAVEAGFPLALPIAVGSSLQSASLPAGPIAVTAYNGPYEKIDAAYDLIADWLRRRGAEPAGDAWESYHSPPIGRPDAWHTEIVQPYSDA